MTEPAGSPGRPAPEAKKWLLLQLFGGFVTMAGLLFTVYVTAAAAQAKMPLQIPLGSVLVPVGIVVHILGRIGLRRTRP